MCRQTCLHCNVSAPGCFQCGMCTLSRSWILLVGWWDRRWLVRNTDAAVNFKMPISSGHWPTLQPPVTLCQYHHCSHNNSTARISYIGIICGIRTNNCSFFRSMNSFFVSVWSLRIIVRLRIGSEVLIYWCTEIRVRVGIVFVWNWKKVTIDYVKIQIV